jgi:hypothetical protein
METETIDKLFLELSQVTQATTAKELRMQKLLARCAPHLGREVTSAEEAEDLRAVMSLVRSYLDA